jgi:3-oxoacyl-[acyl-carrier-protein] synthase II
MKAYIHAYCTISMLDSVEKGILSSMDENPLGVLVEPAYKELISGSYLRRMSKVIKMGVATALMAGKEETIEGIIVGSGAGCYHNTVLFIGEYNGRETGELSPHAFIQSTDNTIAGQIALILQNYSYNITYIQKGLAFENALVDAMLLSEENECNVLVGGVDEWVPLFELSEQTKALHPDYWIGEGSTFFMVKQEKEGALAAVLACGMLQANKDSLDEKLTEFLEQQGLDLPDLVLYGNSFVNETPVSNKSLGVRTFCYSNLSGIYFTNSAFGNQLAVEILSDPVLAAAKGLKAGSILVVNNFYDTDWGITYLSAVQ